MNPFKEVLKDCNRKFTQPPSRAHFFITQNLFNERLSVAGYKLTFGDKIFESTFWQIFRWFIFAYDETVTILNRLIFAFAKSVLLAKFELDFQKWSVKI